MPHPTLTDRGLDAIERVDGLRVDELDSEGRFQTVGSLVDTSVGRDREVLRARVVLNQEHIIRKAEVDVELIVRRAGSDDLVKIHASHPVTRFGEGDAGLDPEDLGIRRREDQ